VRTYIKQRRESSARKKEKIDEDDEAPILMP